VCVYNIGLRSEQFHCIVNFRGNNVVFLRSVRTYCDVFVAKQEDEIDD
jgi:hypothetical protein